MLDSRGLKLVPGFFKHDLDHLILGYGMDPEEELCMQAYLIGNGRWQIQVFLFLSSALLLPGLWGALWAHYKSGRQSPVLTSLTFENCLTQNTDQIRRQYAPISMLITGDGARTPIPLVG
jgi:ubiquinone biosynthesis protein Coq4